MRGPAIREKENGFWETTIAPQERAAGPAPREPKDKFLARIEAVAFGVDDVVDAVEKQAQRKDDVEEPGPEAAL